MAENFELRNKDFEGMKIYVFAIRKISEEGKRNLKKSLRSITRFTFKPISVIYLPFSEADTSEKLAQFIYDNFGASHEGKAYKIIYWRKVNAWSRRYASLCWIKLWDTDVGKFRFEIIRGLGNLKRFRWFKEK